MIKDSTYQPNNDPLMNRLNRKYNPMGSVYTVAGRGRLFTQDSRTSKNVNSRVFRPFEFQQSPAKGSVIGMGGGNSLGLRDNNLINRKLNIRKVNQTAILEEV